MNVDMAAQRSVTSEIRVGPAWDLTCTSKSISWSNCSVPSMDFTIEEGDRGQMMVSALPSYARQRASKTLMPFFLAVLR